MSGLETALAVTGSALAVLAMALVALALAALPDWRAQHPHKPRS